jgi:hypothetical protein
MIADLPAGLRATPNPDNLHVAAKDRRAGNHAT